VMCRREWRRIWWG